MKAKRYLVSTTPGYFESLSDASKATFIEQNGRMDAELQKHFKNQRLFMSSIFVRRLDDVAKSKALEKEMEILKFWQDYFEFLWETYAK